MTGHNCSPLCPTCHLAAARSLLREARDLLDHRPDHGIAGRPACPACALEARIDKATHFGGSTQ